MTSLFMRMIEACLDLLFPPMCVSCKAHGAWWCVACRHDVEHALAGDMPAIEGLDGCTAIGLYHDPRLRSVIHSFKYRGGSILMQDVADFIDSWAWTRRMPWSDEIGLAVQPLIGSPSRVRERGFDQAVLLAEAVAALTVPDASTVDLLVRHEGLGAQALITQHDLREANVSGMFEARRGVPMPEAVLLVDDVMTTGSTVREAARVLRAEGVSRVYAFALAIGA